MQNHTPPGAGNLAALNARQIPFGKQNLALGVDRASPANPTGRLVGIIAGINGLGYHFRPFHGNG